MNPASQPWPLSQETLAQGVAFLSRVDQDFARIAVQLGHPPLWARQPGFPTLVHIILEQQVSLASARAAFIKLQARTLAATLGTPGVTPATFLTLADDELKQIGFSRQKAGYCRELARSLLSNEIDLDALDGLDDPAARLALMKIKGIGPWTADIYLLMALLRPDIWPAGDLAIAAALQELKGLPSRPDPAELDRIALPWRPWRAVAARLLWHYYLSERKLVLPIVPDFLSHYYDPANAPFQNLSDLPLDQAEQLFGQLRTAGVTFASQRVADYLTTRRRLEEQVRERFIARGGKPHRLRPHYMILGACPWVKSWYQDGRELRIPLANFDPSIVSFTYGDTFPAMHYEDGKPYRKQVYTLVDLPALVREYGLPQEWNRAGALGPDRYIEAQVWDDLPLKPFLPASAGSR